MSDVRVEDAHDVQRLYDIRAVVAAQADVRLEVVRFLNALNLLDDICVDLRCSTADLEQCEDEGRELMTEWNSRERDAACLTDTVDCETWCPGKACLLDGDTWCHACDLFDECAHLKRDGVCPSTNG